MNEENSTTDFKDNPYQYTRAIRFKLEPKQQSQCFKNKCQCSDAQFDLPQLVDLLLDVHTNLTALFLYKDKEDNKETNSKKENRSNELKWSKKLSISKNWLNIWHKNIFHTSIKNLNNKDSKYKFLDLKPLHKHLEKWLDEWKEQAHQFKKYYERPKESQVRRSDIADTIRWFLNKQRLFYIQSLLSEVHTPDPNLDSQVENLKNNSEQLQKELKEAEKEYLSSKSSGIEIAKASFNYYTVNKKSKEGYDQELKNTKIKKYKECCSKIENKQKQSYIWHTFRNGQKDQKVFTFKSEFEKEWLKRYIDKYNESESNENKIKGDLQNSVELSLDQTYHVMKAFKAEQKSIFYELIAHIASDKESGSSYKSKNENHLLKGCEINYEKHDLGGINQTLSLFQFNDQHKNGYYKGKAKEKYNEFIQLTKNIKENGNAKKRGKLLFGKHCYFTGYGNFCELYKKVAQKRGRLITQIKGIKKEREEAKQTSYWGLIYITEDNHKQLWLIPKDKIKDAKKSIDQFSKQNQKLGNSYLCCFESLTMRALHKLCFTEESSFVKEMKEKDSRLWNLQRETKQIETNNNEQKIKEKNQKKLGFLKEVLQSDYAQSRLQIKNFDLQATYQSQNLDEFEKELEKACYYVKKMQLNENEKQQLLKNCDVTVLDITSYDVENRNKNTHQLPKTESENKYHTDLWQIFWKNLDKPDRQAKVKGFSVGELRLNPEVRIRYRKADQNLQKYLEKRGFDKKFKKDKKFTQRGIQDQFTASLTLALNAGRRYPELAFSKPEDLLGKINDFNEKLNNKGNFKTTWKYGIDRGQIELATLCLAKFHPDQTYEVEGKQVAKPEFASIECYTLKDCNYNYKELYNDGKPRKEGKTHRKAIENLSYFIDRDDFNDLFQKEKTSCLDLTTAKVIKGKIFTNGDVMTYLKFKKVSAKRKLYELYAQGKIKNTHLKWSQYKDGKEPLNHHCPDEVLNIDIQTDKGDPETTIYYYCDKYKDILSKDDIKASLNCYLRKLDGDESHVPSIQKINDLRAALTANMIGVISYLYKTYPGFVVLEDLKKGHKDFQHDASIARNLEIALYNKFQSLGLVPPHVKDIIQLREAVRDHQRKENQNQKLISSQIGAIVFVSEENTSKNCPYCEKAQTHSGSKDEKFKQHRFRCESCNFDTYAFKTEEERVKGDTPQIKQDSYNEKFQFLKDIDDPDKVAAYNIAKKLKDSKDIGKMELPKIHKDEKKANSKEYQNRRNKKRNNNYKPKHKSRHLKSIKGGAQQNHSQKLTNKPFANLKDVMIIQKNKVRSHLKNATRDKKF